MKVVSGLTANKRISEGLEKETFRGRTTNSDYEISQNINKKTKLKVFNLWKHNWSINKHCNYQIERRQHLRFITTVFRRNKYDKNKKYKVEKPFLSNNQLNSSKQLQKITIRVKGKISPLILSNLFCSLSKFVLNLPHFLTTQNRGKWKLY